MSNAFTQDDFLCGCLVTDSERKIVYVNGYFEREWGLTSALLLGKNSDSLFTRSSCIFYESYIVPVLSIQKRFDEIQLALLSAKGERIPVIANARLTNEQDLTFWSLFSATKRDRLYEELVEARNTLHEQSLALKALSITDELTGLLNRREIKHRAEVILNLAKRTLKPMSLLMVDVDHFKRINDNHGHQQGDEVLQALSQVLQQVARDSDIVGRFGGEEFVLILPNTDAACAQVFCQRLHKGISAMQVTGGPITVSIGISSELIGQKATFEYFVRLADAALYRAKLAGRNRSVLYSEHDSGQ